MAMVYRLWLYGLQVWIGATCTGGARARGKSRVWAGARGQRSRVKGEGHGQG